MSNALALAAVTAVMRDLLNNGLIDHNVSDTLGNVNVTATAPDLVTTNGDDEARLNLFLYRVSPNSGWRNADLPGMDGEGRTVRNPPLALDLHYLLTAYGAEDFHAEILLGYAMQLLHEMPVLARDAVRRALGPPAPVDASPLPPAFRALAAAELADQVELVKLAPEEITVDDISRLWAAFLTPYRPTAGYRASVVLIESRRRTRSTLPVATGRVYALQFRVASIDTIEALDGGPILARSPIRLAGNNLRGANTHADIDGILVEPIQLSDRVLTALLPSALRPGVHAVQIVEPLMMGEPPVEHQGFESNVAAFVLSPKVVAAAPSPAPGAGAAPYDGAIEIEVDPEVGRAQRTVLMLTATGGGTASYAFSVPARSQDSSSISVPVTDVERGEYFVGLQIDGALSPVGLEAARPDFGPTLTI